MLFDLLAICTDIPGWLEAYDEALAYDFTTFLGGHLGKAGSREDVELVRDYVTDVEASAVEALDRGAFVGEVGQVAGFHNAWYLFDEYSKRIAEDCAVPVIEKWAGQLGGVETFTDANCLRMQYSRRID